MVPRGAGPSFGLGKGPRRLGAPRKLGAVLSSDLARSIECHPLKLFIPNIDSYNAAISACERSQQPTTYTAALPDVMVAPRLLGFPGTIGGDSMWPSRDAGFTLNGNACQANACACTGGSAAARISGKFDGDCICACRGAGKTHVKPSLAAALVAPRLLGLLALPIARISVQVAKRDGHSACKEGQQWQQVYISWR